MNLNRSAMQLYSQIVLNAEIHPVALEKKMKSFNKH